MSEKKTTTIVNTIVCLTILTFTMPAAQWFAGKFVTNPELRGTVSSVSIILGVGLLIRKQKAIWLRAFSAQWKMFYYLALTVVLGLLVFNIQDQPVAKMTGRARMPLEVFDLIALLPVAEELIFRGAIWSMLEKITSSYISILAGTSLLFGVEHLGYWTQTNWPLSPEAYLHVISMVFAGVFFGFFRFKSGSLTIPALLHMLANGAILLTQ